MPDLLSLASDFFERMANPAYGSVVNDEYALRLGALLTDERTQSFFAREAERLSDPDALTAYGWLWFLGYARARSLRLSDELLLRLAERWSSVPMLVTVIDVATGDEERAERWLESLVQRVTFIEEQPDELQHERDFGANAESLLVALLQTGNEPSLSAARNLLRRDWRGQRRLLQLFWSLTDELDDDTRRLWISMLAPPPRPGEYEHRE